MRIGADLYDELGGVISALQRGLIRLPVQSSGGAGAI
jgi:hypothetical protein